MKIKSTNIKVAISLTIAAILVFGLLAGIAAANDQMRWGDKGAGDNSEATYNTSITPEEKLAEEKAAGCDPASIPNPWRDGKNDNSDATYGTSMTPEEKLAEEMAMRAAEKARKAMESTVSTGPNMEHAAKQYYIIIDSDTNPEAVPVEDLANEVCDGQIVLIDKN